MGISIKFCYLLIFSLLPAFGTSSPSPLPIQDAYELGIEVTTNMNSSPLYLPVGAMTKKKRMFVTVPVKGATADVAAVRIVPILENGKVKLDIFYLSDDFWKSSPCVDIQMLHSSRVETRYIGNGESLNLAESKSNSDVLVTIKTVNLRSNKRPGTLAEDPDSPCGCARCGTQNPLWCCPARGKCLGCGTCGDVCCPNNGLPE